MRVALIGGSGQLGTEIRRRWTDDEIVAPPHAEIDIEDAAAVAAMLDAVKPDAVVNCAAFHNVDRCEAEPGRAFAVNAVAVDRVAHLCDERSTAFVTISTDYVFDGASARPYVETDRPAPLSAYGVSKLAGELLALRLRSRALVVRTCGVYGVRPSASKGYTFVDRVIAQARAGEPIRIVNDVTASPTFAGDLALAIRFLLERRASGLYHAANAGPVTWHAFAVEALRQAGIAYPVEPIPAASWKAPARRPAFSALDSGKLRALGFDMPGWREGIEAYLYALGLAAVPGEE
ncbi:MAG: dTDP-4-dehydrorhamnose reductase [Candidatus Eremiobacteraeota bacterium]|nr:dTDP-4-dehydrorhamnose reductase [Candidatus Eremiobacteraeota bacterium]